MQRLIRALQNKVPVIDRSIKTYWILIAIFLANVVLSLLEHKSLGNPNTIMFAMLVFAFAMQLFNLYRMKYLADTVVPKAITPRLRSTKRGFKLDWPDEYGTASAVLVPARENVGTLRQFSDNIECSLYFDPRLNLPFMASLAPQNSTSSPCLCLVYLPSHSQLNDTNSTPATKVLILANCIAYIASICGHWNELLQPSVETLINSGSSLGALEQPWRLFTCCFLHMAWWHLLFNMLALLYIGRICEKLVGTGRFLAVYFIAGIGGALTSVMIAPKVSVGASGAIMGLFGFLFTYKLLSKSTLTSPLARATINSVCLSFFIALLIVLPIPQVDNAVHIGGAIFGALAACFLVPERRSRIQANAIIVTIVAFIGLWMGANYRYSRFGLGHQVTALQAVAAERWPQAVDEMSQAIDLDPSNITLHKLRSLAAEKAEQFDLAVSDFKLVMNKDDDDLEQYNQLAWLQDAAGQYKDAVVNADYYLSKKEAPHVLDTRAVAYMGLKQFDRAKVDLAKALKLNENEGAAYFHTAQILSTTGNKEGAKWQLSQSQKNGYKPAPWELRFGQPN